MEMKTIKKLKMIVMREIWEIYLEIIQRMKKALKMNILMQKKINSQKRIQVKILIWETYLDFHNQKNYKNRNRIHLIQKNKN
jgi:hypothetical protein